MPEHRQPDDVAGWTDIILDPVDEIISSLIASQGYIKLFTEDLARYLYDDMHRSRMLITSPFTFKKNFSELESAEKDHWYEYTSGIPLKLKSLGLMIRRVRGFSRTCIITDEEIEKLAFIDLEKYCIDRGMSFDNLPDARKWYYRELNYLIPPQLMKTGFEIIRPGEDALIAPATIRKLARAIHSRYLQKMRNGDREAQTNAYPGDSSQYIMDFDSLPDEIKFSNTDNAYHIATKLIAVGYRIMPLEEGFKAHTLHLSDDEIETMARIEHIRWSWDKRLNGWIYGNVKDNEKKVHPGLIPYEQLSENEKDKDRELVKMIPALLQDIGYTARPIVPDRIKNLSYAIKPQSSIHKLLHETRKLNEEIRMMSAAHPVIEEKVRIINRKIEETITEVRGNYEYARHIQETFLPEDLFIRECFPDSFVLYKPKDIVSGDFYFFSRQGNKVVFAAADCTGHGIPGALLSTLGYGITEQAVNEKRISDPGAILAHIYSKVHKFLRRKEETGALSDDMDIAVCTFDESTRILTYAGVRNPLYRISEGELIQYPAKNYINNCDEADSYIFESEAIRVKKGDLIYVFSDGYSDQFGGKAHKRYQLKKFRALLLSVNSLSMPEQKDRLYEEIENWREENDEDQTDDILVLGVRI